MPDPKGDAALRAALAGGSAGVQPLPLQIHSCSVYLIEGELSDDEVQRIASELLADPVTEEAIVDGGGAIVATSEHLLIWPSPLTPLPRGEGNEKPSPLAPLPPPRGEGDKAAIIEIHPLPGVTDPDAPPIELAIHAMLGKMVRVRTGRRFDLDGIDAAAARELARRCLANTVIHAIHDRPYHPASFPVGSPYQLNIRSVRLRDLDDAALTKLSRESHLFLSLDEMKAIQREYESLGRDPREIELETLAQTWSEHCVHKTLKATINYRESNESPGIAIPGLSRANLERGGRPGHELNDDGSVTIHNLLKSTVAAATHELIAEGIDWCLSVFVDNAGVIAFDDDWAVCFKCETHNHPSAIEPYGGAATGIGGCIRDIMGTGLAAKPIAATDVFCVAHPDSWKTSDEGTERRSDGGLVARDSARLERTAKSSMPSSLRPFVAPSLLPAGVIHPRRVLTEIVAGVRDYGNRMGIPTLNGAVWFHDDYVGNPLVYCGCIGIMPRDKIKGAAQRGDRIIALGGRTGRDGIHGATFSSAELTDTHADEFSHAVQIGNAVTEKKLLDAILAARDFLPPSPLGPPQGVRGEGLLSPSPFGRGVRGEDGTGKGAATCLYNAITDCGAGGFSSAIGEMGEALGAEVHLDRAPLKYEGLSPTEIWISEAQERMVLAVPPHNVDALRAICDQHDVEMCDLGHFGTENVELTLLYHGSEVGRLPMAFLHDGLPEMMREAVFQFPPPRGRGVGDEGGSGNDASPQRPSIKAALLQLLAHPNIASKRWIIRQYDHEVQGATVIKPLVGMIGGQGGRGGGPSDAAVIQPVAGSHRGLGIACGLATGFAADPYAMTLSAIDECVRNLVCVGVDPSRIAILDNFCWPSCTDPRNLGDLVRAAEACYDGAKAYRTPFISGKDSLNNQFTTEDGRTIQIPPTLLISGMGIVPDVRGCVTMDAKRAGNLLMLVGELSDNLRGSHYELIFGGEPSDEGLPCADLELGPAIARKVHDAIARGLVRSAHDVSDGGILVAAAEMAFAGDLGIELHPLPSHAAWFAEAPSRYLLEVHPSDVPTISQMLGGMPLRELGVFTAAKSVRIASELDVPVSTLRDAWNATLDW